MIRLPMSPCSGLPLLVREWSGFGFALWDLARAIFIWPEECCVGIADPVFDCLGQVRYFSWGGTGEKKTRNHFLGTSQRLS